MRALLVLVAILGVTAVALAQSVTGERPECVTASASSRWAAAGYNHAVTVTNGCDYRVSCSVSTDVNPAVQSFSLDPGAERSLTTFMDAPGYGFVASVACER